MYCVCSASSLRVPRSAGGLRCVWLREQASCANPHGVSLAESSAIPVAGPHSWKLHPVVPLPKQAQYDLVWYERRSDTRLEQRERIRRPGICRGPSEVCGTVLAAPECSPVEGTGQDTVVQAIMYQWRCLNWSEMRGGGGYAPRRSDLYVVRFNSNFGLFLVVGCKRVSVSNPRSLCYTA